MGVERRGRQWAAILYNRGDRTWLGSFETRREATRTHAKAVAGTKRRQTGTLTVDQWADRWLCEFPPAEESTRRTYPVAAKSVARAFAGIPLGDVVRQRARVGTGAPVLSLGRPGDVSRCDRARAGRGQSQ